MVGRMTDSICHRSSVVEHTLGKGEVTGSNPVGGLGTGVVVDGLQQLETDCVGPIHSESPAREQK